MDDRIGSLTAYSVQGRARFDAEDENVAAERCTAGDWSKNPRRLARERPRTVHWQVDRKALTAARRIARMVVYRRQEQIERKERPEDRRYTHVY